MDNQTKELIKCKVNVNYFLQTYVFVETPGGTIPLNPYKKQLDLVQSILTDHYLCVLKSRQIGISTVVQALCVYLTTFFPNITVGIISRDGPEATDFVRKCRIMFENLPKWMRPKYIKRTEQTFELENNSRIISSTVNLSNPQSVFRGKTITFLVLDEAAFIRRIEDAFVGISPSVTTAHRQAQKNNIPYGIVILSTPNGISGIGEWFYKMYIQANLGQSIFKPMTIHYSEAPFTDEQWLETQKRILIVSKGPDAIKQELELKFIANTDSFFEEETFEFLQNTMENSKEPVAKTPRKYFNKEGKSVGEGEWTFFEYPVQGKSYIIGCDVAPSYGVCKSAIEIVDEDFNQVAEFTGKLRIMDLENEVIYAGTTFENSLVVVEANSYAAEMVERLAEHDIIGNKMYFRTKKDKKGKIISSEPGLMTDNNTKPKMMTSMYWKITENPGCIKSKHLAGECLALQKNYRSSRLTDRLMSIALIAYVFDYDSEFIPKSISPNDEREIKNFLDNMFLEKPNTITEEIKRKKYKELTDEEFHDFMFRDIEIYKPEDIIQQENILLF